MAYQGFPANVRIIGVMHKDTIKMFMTSVVWSDKNEVTIYRSFKDFKKLHKQLKKKHPVANPFRKEDRILPRFRGMKRNFQRKGPSKTVHRVKALEKYCTELLQCDPSVTQSSEVVQFFCPKNHDLEPEFAKNSIIIVPSDVLSEIQRDGTANPHDKRFSMGNITKPFLTQTYRTVAPFETKDLKNRPFKVDVNKTLDVLIKDQKGWWLVENEEKHLAWFPAPYLEPCEEDDDDVFDTVSSENTFYCAARNYVSKNRDEVSVHIGSVVEVLRKSGDGWWLIRYSGRVGYVPSMYLQPYNNPHVSLQRAFHSSTFNLSSLQPHPSQRQGIPRRLAPTSHSRSLENLLEPRRVRANTAPDSQSARLKEPDSRKSCISAASDETDFGFSSSGSLSGAEAEQEAQIRGSSTGEAEARDGPDTGESSGEMSPSRSCSGSPSDSPAGTPTLRAATLPRVPPRPLAQEIFTRCTTYTREAAMASRARLFPQQMEIQTRL
ncbi:NADPH oxidase organizer 1-like isoform X2 [Clupea harengus]|uniref:NADPH oxidase organizer 1-like isoform X2 n=1 Tax=Clupea harengus TaxID=7950 RepID=A0A6P8EVT0_CLUHA|nr:NADPH oxidase organizer 1-like isoform X2 [Clupea harengus]